MVLYVTFMDVYRSFARKCSSFERKVPSDVVSLFVEFFIVVQALQSSVCIKIQQNLLHKKFL